MYTTNNQRRALHMKNHFLRPLFAIIFYSVLLPLSAQEIGANFNHNPDIIDFEYLKKTPVKWIRTTPYIFEYINGERDIETEEGLTKVIEAKKMGYKVAFGFRWDFKKYNLNVPQPDSEEEQRYFVTASKLIERIGPYIDVFKLGNEPNLETKKSDLHFDGQHSVPIVVFTQRLLDKVIEPYYHKNNHLSRPDVYVGSLPRLFMQEEQDSPGVKGLIELAASEKRIKGLSVHLHISDSSEMDEVFRYVRTIMPDKPIIVPEFSLFRLYNKHVSDELGDSKAGIKFAKDYGYTPSMKLYEWFSKANSVRVGATEWEDMFASRTWFPQHFMKTYHRYFKKYGVVLATYGYLSQSAPEKMGPGSPTWFINPIFPMKSLKPQSDGTYTPNPLWYQDFVEIVHAGNLQG